MEENFEEMFDLKAILLPEIHWNCGAQDEEHAPNTVNYWDYSETTQPTNPATSSSSSSSVSPKLISFETNNTVSSSHDMVPDNCKSHPTHDDMASNKDFNSLATSQILSFSQDLTDYEDAALMSQKKAVNGASVCRTVSQARDHLMAERKRRQNLGELFISLSKVVPGLKKLDKASLLEDAINYIKALQERASALEEGMSKRSSRDDNNYELERSMNNKLHSENDDDNCSKSMGSKSEIKARISDNHVLIKVHCKKQMGLMSRVPCQMEKLHLNVVDMRILPFGDQSIDITLLAQMQSEFQGTVKDIVDHLHTIFFNHQDPNAHFN